MKGMNRPESLPRYAAIKFIKQVFFTDYDILLYDNNAFDFPILINAQHGLALGFSHLELAIPLLNGTSGQT